jgi:putative transposase
LKRYKSGHKKWNQSNSRAPKNAFHKRDKNLEQLIVTTRKELIAEPFSQYGPQAIFYRLEQQGYKPPQVWYIARVLKRYNLVHKKKKSSYIAKGKRYPYSYVLCHQMDFVGPRYLSNKARYYFLTLIDCDSHRAQTSVLENQTSDAACQELVRFWKQIGIPDFLQMDNDLAFWGSLKKPGALGKVIRLALSLGVTPVFIPQREPWRNGVIEHFNKTMQEYLLKMIHPDLKELSNVAHHYDQVHNEAHHYSSQKGMTPNMAVQCLDYPYTALPKEYNRPKTKIQLESGEIHIIRFIRSDLNFKMFGLTFPLPEKAKYEYVLGIILVEEHRLLIFKEHELLTEFKFIVM